MWASVCACVCAGARCVYVSSCPFTYTRRFSPTALPETRSSCLSTSDSKTQDRWARATLRRWPGREPGTRTASPPPSQSDGCPFFYFLFLIWLSFGKPPAKRLQPLFKCIETKYQGGLPQTPSSLSLSSVPTDRGWAATSEGGTAVRRRLVTWRAPEKQHGDFC